MESEKFRDKVNVRWKLWTDEKVDEIYGVKQPDEIRLESRESQTSEK